jgi:predicted lipid-binding transport protein (Tim44 family)
MKHDEPQVSQNLIAPAIICHLGAAQIYDYMVFKDIERTPSLSVDPLLVVLTAAAVFIFWRLKSVLGQRTGLERPPLMPIATPDASSKVIDAKPNSKLAEPIWQGVAEEGSDLAKGIESIAEAQKDFNVSEFLNGAKSAYELILSAFAKGDKVALKPLLAKPVMDSFAAAIDSHKAKGETKFFRFVSVNSAKLESAILDGKRAIVEVLFESEMINATLDSSGATLAGESKAIVQSSETWTFERDITSRDPNWKLMATSDAPE